MMNRDINVPERASSYGRFPVDVYFYYWPALRDPRDGTMYRPFEVIICNFTDQVLLGGIGRHAMPIADRKEADDVVAIVHAVAPSGRSGIELDTLAPRVSITSNRIEKLLRRHADYIVRVGDARKIALNRFGEFNGSAERIIADVEQSYKRSSRQKIAILVVLILVGVFSGVTA